MPPSRKSFKTVQPPSPVPLTMESVSFAPPQTLPDLTALSSEQLDVLLAQARILEKARRKPKNAPLKADEIKYLSQQQVAGFFRAIKDVRDTALFRVIYHRGLRASEASLMQLADWDGEAGVLTFRRKKGSAGGRYRLVNVEARAVRAWIKQRGAKAGPLFISRNHQGIGRKQVYRLMRRYAIAAGIPGELAHPHSLKHSCGTHVLALVKDLVKVKDHLGHRSIQSTEIYAQVLGKTREEVADQLKDWR